jgi:hypothetical protein
VAGRWWGDRKSLHLDCWGAVEQADGYDIMTKAVEDKPVVIDCAYMPIA